MLAAIQGITEFLPISSSSHLILFPLLTDYEDQGLGFDIALHFGSLMAIMAFYRKELAEILNKSNEGIHYMKLIIIASIPLPIAGIFLIEFISENLRNLHTIGFMTIAFALLLYFSDRNSKSNQTITNLSLSLMIIIGFFQIIALIPGVSRSGIVITAALLLHLNRSDSIKVAFLLSIPALFMASIYQGIELYYSQDDSILENNILGALLSFVFSYTTIKLLVLTINRITFAPFIIYRLFLGTFLLII